MTTDQTRALEPELPSIANGVELTAETFSDFVQRLRHHVRGEGVNWHCTADALFTVQARRIIYGIDRDYTDKVAVCVEDQSWFSPADYWSDADEETRQTLDRLAGDEDGKPFLGLDVSDQWGILEDLDDHTVTGWDEQWEYVNSHFTKEAAEAFIRRKKHDYRHGMRVYVEAQVYCWEFNAIINGLLDGRISFVQPGALSAIAADRNKREGEPAATAVPYGWINAGTDQQQTEYATLHVGQENPWKETANAFPVYVAPVTDAGTTGGMNMRKVIYQYGKIEPVTAYFHQWAQEDNGEGQSNPVAIIEREDGQVETVYAGYIKFIDAPLPNGEIERKTEGE